MFKRSTEVKLPFDMRHKDPKKNYGIHGLDVWFILQGPKGAITFLVNFDIYLPHIEAEERPKWRDMAGRTIRGLDVSYHSPVPVYDGQESGPCQILEGGRCFCDGSSIRGDDWAKDIFSTRGEHPGEKLWSYLESEYYAVFGKD